MDLAIDLQELAARGIYKCQRLAPLILERRYGEDLVRLADELRSRNHPQFQPLIRFIKRAMPGRLDWECPAPSRSWLDGDEGNEVVAGDDGVIQELKSRIAAEIPKIPSDREITFAVKKNGEWAALVPCELLTTCIGCGDKPARIYYLCDGEANMASVTRTILRYLDFLMREYIVYVCNLHLDINMRSFTDALGLQTIWSRTASAFIDLTMSEQEIWSGVRKSYRSLINYGKKHFSRSFMFRLSDIDEHIKSFVENNEKFRGRFAAFTDELAIGSGLGLVYRKDDAIVGLTCVTRSGDDGGIHTYYAGIYDKSSKSIPCHYCLYDAIMVCKSIKGSRKFLLMHDEFIGEDKKVEDIKFFKRGYTQNNWTEDIVDIISIPATKDKISGVLNISLNL